MKLLINTIIISTSLFAASVFSSPLKELNKVGEGEMQYLFWTLYTAELYRDANFQDENQSQALRIVYEKSISKDALIEATAQQWEHLNYSQEDIDRWIEPLESLWPNVEPGDALTLKTDETGVSQFYFGDQSLGKIQDPEFGDAFLSIWLSQNTTEPELRKQLLGLAK
ncbi:chalcone isomerase family protein [Vibrio mexicanus]|uniref:chalcone isomerase family protein n=1 Tax=Vibrio mexicanus TaxID=1004326 RepID=UPI00063CED5A|nr:chalcone isomerase family protein [Vibrio mexicanus]